MKKIIILITFVILVLALGKNLNPFDRTMFDFHDETQAARVQQFSLNIRSLHIPPRMAPDFSFSMGYPIFNFYAPTAYWITSGLNLVGFDVIAALKLSFLLAILTGAIGVYLFLSEFFEYENALLGATLYVTSLYMAVDIFVRGNLSEVWFMALMPLSLYVMTQKKYVKYPLPFISTVVIVFLTVTSHNLLSLLFLPILCIYIFLQKDYRRLRFLAVLLALFLGMYFFLPFFAESSLTYASQVAKSTHYSDHFLCPVQLWQSAWGFGGSAPGCESDGISFKVGKPQLVIALMGLLYLLISPVLTGVHKKNMHITWFFACVAVASLFLTTYASRFVWDAAAPLAAVIQFPWRFIALSLIGLVYLAAFFTQQIRSFPYKPIMISLFAALILLSLSKYFYKPGMDTKTYNKRYLSSRYIAEKVAFKVSEYLPRTADYGKWKDTIVTGYTAPATSRIKGSFMNLDNSDFTKELKMTANDLVALNIHYFPYWKLTLNNNVYIPKTFDYLGRPLMNARKGDVIRAEFAQSPTEHIGNSISLATLCILTAVAFYKPIWKKMSSLNT